MKKFIMLFLSCLFISVSANAEGFCPTPQEYQAKMQYFQQKAMNLMNSKSSMLQSQALMKEEESYMNSTFPGCLQYFKTTSNPDCSKLQTFATSYMMLDNSKQAGAKTQLNSLPNLQGKCGYQYDTFKMLTK